MGGVHRQTSRRIRPEMDHFEMTSIVRSSLSTHRPSLWYHVTRLGVARRNMSAFGPA